MQQYLTTALSLFFLGIEKFKGAKTVYKIDGPNNALGNLQCQASCDYELTIFCQRKDYLVKYDKWYIPNRSLRTYRMSSITTGQAPCSLQKVSELEIDLPAFVSTLVPEKFIAKTMINAYLDLLVTNLSKGNCVT